MAAIELFIQQGYQPSARRIVQRHPDRHSLFSHIEAENRGGGKRIGSETV
jgi:hypothetical protein